MEAQSSPGEPPRLRVIFLGSPPFATPTLRGLVGSPFRPVAVVTPPDKPRGRGKVAAESEVAALAGDAGVPLLRPTSARDPEFLDQLRALEPDVCLVVSYGELLTQEFLDVPRLGSLNVHGSLLPRHRGASPVQAALLAGDAETGVSIQRVVLALDAGDVLLERRVAIAPEETAGELFERLAELGPEAALAALEQLAGGTATFTPQDSDGVTVCRKLKKRDGELDWTRTAAELERHVRAMTPWPGARTTNPKGQPLVVARAHVALGDGDLGDGTLAEARPGTLVEVEPRCIVACGEGALVLERVQSAGKRQMDAAEWLRGARLEIGARLGPQNDEIEERANA